MVNNNDNQYLYPHSDDSDLLSIRSFLDKIIHAWPTILICLLLCIVGAFVVNRYTEPLYRSSTSLMVTEQKDMNNAVSELLYGQELFGGSGNLENEAYLLKSYALVKKTLQDLNFSISYFVSGNIRDNEIYKNSPLRVTVFDDSEFVPYQSYIKCTIVDQSSYKLEFIEASILSRLKGVIQNHDLEKSLDNRLLKFGELEEYNGFKFLIDLVPGNNSGYKEIIFKIDSYDYLTDQYLNNLNVAPLSMESSILEISVVSSHQEKVSDYINKLVDNYIVNELERKNITAERTIDFINAQILMMSDSLSSVEGQLETFKKSNTQLTISTEGNNYLQKSQEFQEARNQLILNNRYLNELEGYINDNNMDEIVIPASIGITDQALNKSIQDLVSLQLQIQAIGSSKNPVVRSYQTRIEVLKNSIIENIRSIRNANNLALGNIDQQVGGMRNTLRNLPTAEREFINIQRNYNLSEKLYLFLMEKKAEAGIAKASNTIDIRVIDQARPAYKPISPKPVFNYVVAILLGLTLPIGVMFITDMLNNKVTSKDELLKITSIPYLGLIAKNRGKSLLITNGQIRTEVSETFRTIRSNLRYMLGSTEAGAKTFLLTSSVSSEGKSFCSSNLAVVFSNFGKRVLLIDADMRKEKNYEEFSVVDAIGLSDYLAGISGREQIVKNTSIPNLKIITSGGIPPNPSELLISGKFERLLDELKSDFDYIIIDTPPIGILSDGLELMDKCDVNIFVARENYTLKRHILDLNNIYHNRKLSNLAILLNAVNYRKSEYGSYGKYYNQYYSNTNKSIKKNKKILQT